MNEGFDTSPPTPRKRRSLGFQSGRIVALVPQRERKFAVSKSDDRRRRPKPDTPEGEEGEDPVPIFTSRPTDTLVPSGSLPGDTKSLVPDLSSSGCVWPAG
jgi:hypothetical protein